MSYPVCPSAQTFGCTTPIPALGPDAYDTFLGVEVLRDDTLVVVDDSSFGGNDTGMSVGVAQEVLRRLATSGFSRTPGA